MAHWPHVLPFVTLAALLPLGLLGACGDGEVTVFRPDGGAVGDDAAIGGDDDASTTDAGSGSRDSGPGTVMDASCKVTVKSHPIPARSVHIDEGDVPDNWSSNPPSSGDHYGQWGAYKEYTSPPLDRRYYLHSMEHGAVVLLYKCPSGCTDVVQGLRDVVKAVPEDPKCAEETNGAVRVRIVTTPDKAINTKIAAAAWGWTYEAECLDKTTLRAFIEAHGYGKRSPENFCSGGITP